MTTPNAMPRNNNPIKQQILAALIETKPTTWHRTAWTMNKDTDQLEEVKVPVTRESLRWSLAQNVSESNVEALSVRWLK